MKFGSSSFFVGLPVIFESNPEGDEEGTYSDDGRNASTEGGPIELEPGGTTGLVNVPELIAVRLPVLINRWLLGRCTGSHVELELEDGVGRRGDVKLMKFGKTLSILRERSKERPFEESS